MNPDQLRVLILVDHAIGSSGPHRNVVGSLNALSSRGDVNLRLVCKHVDDSERYALSGRVNIVLGYDPHSIRKTSTNLLKLTRAVRGCDLIYVPSGLKSFLYGFVCRGRRVLVAGPNVSGIPFVMNPYNPSPLMTMRMCDAWIEMSEVRVQECMAAGTPRRSIHFIPHAIDTDSFHPLYRQAEIWQKEGLSKATKKIVFTGRMDEERKGIPQLLEAFSIIRQRIPNSDLILVGKPSDYLDVATLKSKGIHIIGPRYGSELVRLLASADLFLAASRYETFWFAPLEAMACGVPVVISNVGAVPTMIPENGVQGRTVQIVDPASGRYLPDAPQRLAEAAIPLLEDDNSRLQMGKAGRSHVVREFSEVKLGDRLVRAFRAAIRKTPAF